MRCIIMLFAATGVVFFTSGIPEVAAQAQPATAASQTPTVDRDFEREAWRLYPNIFGDAGRRAEYVRSQTEEKQKHQYKMEKRELINTGK